MNASKMLEKVQVASAIYDYLAAGIFAFPVIALWFISSTMHGSHEMMGAIGTFPVFDNFHMLFVNLFGGFVIMWSTLRIIKRDPIMGLCDGLLRWYYAILMLLYVLNWQTTSILFGFVVMELFWGTWQVFLYYLAKRQKFGQPAASIA